MKTQAKENKLYPRVTLDCRISCTHKVFQGDGYTAQVVVQLVTMQAFEECLDRLNKRSNKVKLKRTQVLTSVRTLADLTGFTKHRIEKALKKLEEVKLIQRQKCEDMPGLNKNDGEVITVLRLASCPALPDTSATTKSDDINNTSTNSTSRKQFKPPTYDEVLTYAQDKEWPNAKGLADKFYEYYDGTGWIKEKVGKPVRNWKLTMCDWQTRQNDTPATMTQSNGSIFKEADDGRVMRYEGFSKGGPEELLKRDMAAQGTAA